MGPSPTIGFLRPTAVTHECLTMLAMGRGIHGWTCKQLERMVKEAGWRYDRSRGGHRYYVHSDHKHTVTIPWHRSSAVKPKTAQNIFETAGIKQPR